MIVEGAISIQTMVFDNTYGVTIPTFFTTNGIINSPTIALPETARFLLRPLDSYRDMLRTSIVPRPDGTLLVDWSKFHKEWQDYFPHERLHWPYIARRGTIEEGTVKNIGGTDRGLNPVIIDPGDKDGPRIAYEKLLPLDTMYTDRNDSSHFQFSKYRSSIYIVAPFTPMLILMQPMYVGNGFEPKIQKGADGEIYVLWFDADSNNAPTVAVKYRRVDFLGMNNGEEVTLIEQYPWQRYGINPYTRIQWSVDSSGTMRLSDGIQRIIRYHSASGISIDSLTASQNIVDVHFMRDGEVRAVWAESGPSLSLVRQYYSSSKNAPLFSQKKNLGEVSIYEQSRFITDMFGRTHLLRYNTPSIIANISAGNVSVSHWFHGYSLVTNAIVDSINMMWIVAKRDSNPVLLRCQLDSLKSGEFHFPMNIGDEWQFIAIQGQSIADWSLYTIHSLKESTAVNGKRYLLYSDGRMLRKEGAKVFSYLPSDSTEYLQYDFSVAPGDTIEHLPWSGLPANVVLESIVESRFGRTFRFSGAVNRMVRNTLRTDVTDSLGVTGLDCMICEVSYEFQGARINGKKYGTLVSVDRPESPQPQELFLHQNYPNPFNPSTQIEFSLPRQSFVTLKIYDVIGREVATLVNETKDAGPHTVQFNASGLTSGMYIACLTNGANMQMKKLLLLK